MLGNGLAVFIQFPEESGKRILHSGKIVQCNDGAMAAVFEEAKLPLVAGQELTVFYEHQRKFVKQPARIDAILQSSSDPGVVVGTPDDPRTWGIKAALTVIGEPVSAESRQSYRVSTAASDRWAQIGGEKCKLMDVSATGYAVMTKKFFDVGKTLAGLITVDNQPFTGEVSIQNARDLG